MRKHSMMPVRGGIPLFLIGLFSMTQIRFGAKIGISEIACCVFAPFLYIKDIRLYRSDGVALYFNLLLLWIGGAIFSDFYNHSFFNQIIRGFSVPVTVFCLSVCIYHNLRQSYSGLKWLLLGIAMSCVLSIFVFQRGMAGDLAADGDVSGAVDAVVGYKLFWANMSKTWLGLPIQGWYLQMPMVYIFPALIAIVIINLLSGGRSSFLVSIFSIFFVMFGLKNSSSMRKIKKMFPLFLICMVIIALTIKWGYGYLVKNGYLNEYETEKFERQTERGSDILSLLIAGRGDFFIGLFAALDKPIVGQGSQALDLYGYEKDYLVKYGSDKEKTRYAQAEMRGAVRTIRAHSHVICYWMWHGIFALIFWLYVLYLVLITVRNRLAHIPSWFGYFAIVLPTFLWDYFFSPFGQRVDDCAMFCALLVVAKVDREMKRARERFWRRGI